MEIRVSNVVHGVNGTAIIINRKMQMGACGPAGRTHIAQKLPLFHILPVGHNIVGHMRVKGRISIAVVHRNVVAVNAGICSRRHRSAADGVDCGTGTGRQINAVVEALLTGDGVGSPAIGGSNGCPIRKRISPASTATTTAAAATAGRSVVFLGFFFLFQGLGVFFLLGSNVTADSDSFASYSA